MQQARKVTPPEISHIFLDYLKEKEKKRQAQSRQLIPAQLELDHHLDNAKLFVIHCHGCSAHNGRTKVPVKVPIVTATRDGQVHTRVNSNTQTKILNPPIIDSITHLIKIRMGKEGLDQHPVEHVFQAAEDMILSGYTKSHPKKYNIGEEIEDIRLFCTGSALFDGFYVVDLKTYKIQSAAKLFGLTTVSDAKRRTYSHDMSRMKEYNKDVLWSEYYKLRGIEDSLREQIRQGLFDSEKISEYARKLGWYNNMRLAKKSVTRASRIKDQDPTNTCILLSSLIDIGIAKKVIKERDCFIVFACRTHEDEPLPPPPIPPTAPSKRTPSHHDEPTHSHRSHPYNWPGRGGKSRKLNKKTRRVKMRLNKTKTKTKTKNRKRKI
jgi:hypothetical protein